MKFDVKKIREETERDYEQTWLATADLLKKEGKFFTPEKKAESHPLFELIFKVRKVLLEAGFKELCLPMIVGSSEVSKQYGPEAAVILDRIFFLAGLDRPDLGISKEKLRQVKKIAPSFNQVEKLKHIFRRYKEAEISPDDLIETMVKELGLREEQASQIISLVFPDFKELKPVPMDLTLRSHTSTLWFPTLQLMLAREPLPIQLFSIGPKFRREQRLDSTHLYESWTASLVVVAEEFSPEDGKILAGEILEKLGAKGVKCTAKRTTSKYYAPGMEFEIFIKHPETGEDIEVGDGGLYSPVALSRYDIPYPVFNLGIGLERLLMVQMGENDIRAVVYPYRYKQATFSDVELTKMIKIVHEPATREGAAIAEAIVRTAREHADAPSPCEFKAFDGKVLGRRVVVKVVEPESGTKLVGPAGFNELYVLDGNIIGVPPKKEDEFLQRVKREGAPADLSYMDGFASLAAWGIEEAIKGGKKEAKFVVKNVKQLSDINLALPEPAQRYITSNKRRVDVRGPMFTTVIAEFD